MRANNESQSLDREKVRQRIVAIISAHSGVPACEIQLSTDIVRDLGIFGEDGWRLLDAITHEFLLAQAASDSGDFYSRFGNEETLPLRPLAFMLTLVGGAVIWATRKIGLHNRRIDELLVWPPSKVLKSKKVRHLLVSEIVERVIEIQSLSKSIDSTGGSSV